MFCRYRRLCSDRSVVGVSTSDRDLGSVTEKGAEDCGRAPVGPCPLCSEWTKSELILYRKQKRNTADTMRERRRQTGCSFQTHIIIMVHKYPNARCTVCSAACCDSGGHRIRKPHKARCCSVCSKWYCGEHKVTHMVRRSKTNYDDRYNVYKCKGCLGISREKRHETS